MKKLPNGSRLKHIKIIVHVLCKIQWVSGRNEELMRSSELS